MQGCFARVGVEANFLARDALAVAIESIDGDINFFGNIALCHAQ